MLFDGQRGRAAAVMGLLAAPSPLAAQAADTVARDTFALPPVTVVATRHRQDVFAVPLAVTQVRPRELFGARGYGLDEALALVPGVLAQSRYGTSDVRLVIRGFGARGAGDRSNAGTSRGVRVLLDGFPETEPDGRTSLDGIDLAAAHAIDVIRSNASALWGNAAGGVVSISTVPALDGALATLEGVGGSFGLRRWAATTGTPLGTGQLTASFVRTDFEGWRVHSGSERSLLNVALLTPVARDTRLGVFALATVNLFRIPGPLTSAQVASDPRQANATYLQRDERRHNRVGRLGVTVDHAWGDARELSASVYVNPKFLQRSERGTFRDFTRYHLGGNVVLRARTTFGGVGGTLVVGADQAYQDGAILFYSLTPAGTRGDTLRNDQREGALNFGAFVQEELTLGARWALTLGARFDDISYYYQDFLDPSLDADKAFRGVTPKFGLTFRPGAEHTVYASVGGGIEAPAGNETDPPPGEDTLTAINPLLEPIRSTTYEVGSRQVIAFHGGPLRRLSYDVAVYHTAVRNEIVPYRGGRFYFTAASARRRGAELGLTLHGRGGVTLQSAFAYQHHRYGRYLVDSTHYGTPGRFADYSGNRVVGVPDFTYAASVAVAPPAPRALRPLRLQLGLQGTSSYCADDANQVRVPAYRTASVTVGVDDPVALGGGLTVRGFVTVNNLFDRGYIASAFLNPDVVGGAPVAFEPGLRRNLVVGITLARATP
jgi:iron complex outermembrane receptor protein